MFNIQNNTIAIALSPRLGETPRLNFRTWLSDALDDFDVKTSVEAVGVDHGYRAV